MAQRHARPPFVESQDAPEGQSSSHRADGRLLGSKGRAVPAILLAAAMSVCCFMLATSKRGSEGVTKQSVMLTSGSVLQGDEHSSWKALNPQLNPGQALHGTARHLITRLIPSQQNPSTVAALQPLPDPAAATQQQQQQQQQHVHLPWEPALTQEEAMKGLAYWGSGKRLRALAAKLMAGQPIKAYTLGGSVTKGQGASTWGASYPSRLFEFINASFPHRDHVLVNKGVSATSSGIFTTCVEQMVAKDADLVILEFTVNEVPNIPYTEPNRQGYEQLIRKLLKLEGQPAIIQMHHFSWWRAYGDGVGKGLFYHPEAEGQLTVMAQYYDIPSLSLRSAVYPLMKAGVKGFKVNKVWKANETSWADGTALPAAGEEERNEYFYADRTHPNDGGHQVIAELLASLLIRATEEARTLQNTAGCLEGGRDSQLPVVPAPMIPGNADVPTSLCAMQEDFKPIVKAAEGFEYRAERPEEDTFVGQKWGWTAFVPGAWAELEFDSRADATAASVAPANATTVAAAAPSSGPTPAAPANGTASAASTNATATNSTAPAVDPSKLAEVYISHLKSYEGMGTALLECVSGCQCVGKKRLDGTWDRKATLMQSHKIKVTQHPACRIRVTVDKKPGEVAQEGHKVTLMALMVSHCPLRLQNSDRTMGVVVRTVKEG